MQTQEWQDGALYTAIWGGAKELFDIITVDDFDEGPRRELAAIIERGMLDHATHMNQWTTRVSNPVRSPRFRSSVSVLAQRPAFAIGVPPDICAFHRYTRNSSLPYQTLARPYRMQVRG